MNGRKSLIFKAHLAGYLLMNNCKLLHLEQNKKDNSLTVFVFRDDKKLHEALHNYLKR